MRVTRVTAGIGQRTSILLIHEAEPAKDDDSDAAVLARGRAAADEAQAIFDHLDAELPRDAYHRLAHLFRNPPRGPASDVLDEMFGVK